MFIAQVYGQYGILNKYILQFWVITVQGHYGRTEKNQHHKTVTTVFKQLRRIYIFYFCIQTKKQ